MQLKFSLFGRLVPLKYIGIRYKNLEKKNFFRTDFLTN